MERGIVREHNLDQCDVLSDEAILSGRIVCQNGMFLDVAKQLEILDRGGRLYVKTRRCQRSGNDRLQRAESGVSVR